METLSTTRRLGPGRGFKPGLFTAGGAEKELQHAAIIP